MSTRAHPPERPSAAGQRQRRSAFRVDAFLDVCLWVGERSAEVEPFWTTTHDISASGLTFTDRDDFGLAADAELDLDLMLPDALVAPPLRMRGHLVPAARRENVRAFHALLVGSADRDRLFRYVLMREREAIAWIRGS